MDNLINHLEKRDGVTNLEIKSFIKYIDTEEYDTDSISMDIGQVIIGSINSYSHSNILVNICKSITLSILPRTIYYYLKHTQCMYYILCVYC